MVFFLQRLENDYRKKEERMRKALLLFLVCIMAVSMAFAGGSSEAADSGLDVIKVSHHPYIHGLPSIVAVDQGIYEKHGLAPEITMYSGGPAQNEACASDAWQVGTTGMAGAVVGCVGYDFKVIGATAYEGSTVDIWVRPDHPIAQVSGQIEGAPDIKGTPDLWKGQTIICQSASNCHLVLLATLEKLGLTGDDITMVDMQVAQSYPAFKAGEADMVALWSPFGYQAEKDGWIKVSSAEAVGLDFYTLMIATDKAIKENPDLVQRWVETYIEATDVIRNNQEDAVQWLYDFSLDEGIMTTLDNCKMDIELRPFPTVEEQKQLMSGELQDLFLTFAQFLVDQGNLQQADYDKLATGSFIDPTFIENL